MEHPLNSFSERKAIRLMDSRGIVISVLLVVIAYLIGNISPATILAKAAGHNIKEEGSGNAGTTNVLRVVGPKAALITLIIDVFKGFIAVKLGYFACSSFGKCPIAFAMIIAAWCGLAVFAGHVWPAVLKFQGGKGVATALGVILATDIKVALVCLGVFAIVVLITRYVSLGSILAAIAFPIVYLFFIYGEAAKDAPYLGHSLESSTISSRILPRVLPLFLMAAILVFKHRANIGRLIRGEENKLSFSKK